MRWLMCVRLLPGVFCCVFCSSVTCCSVFALVPAEVSSFYAKEIYFLLLLFDDEVYREEDENLKLHLEILFLLGEI